MRKMSSLSLSRCKRASLPSILNRSGSIFLTGASMILVVFLAMHLLQIYRYLRFLWKKDKILPEVITVATDGVVCVLPRIWTRRFRPKRHVIAFKDVAELNMSRRRLMFRRYYVHYTC